MGRGRLAVAADDAGVDDARWCIECNQTKAESEMRHRTRANGTTYATKVCLVCNRRKDRLNHAVYQAKMRGLGSDETTDLVKRYY